MKLDADNIIRRLAVIGVDDAKTRLVVLAIVNEINEQLDAALYSVDPTALERLGTMIAEHALEKQKLPRPSEVPVEQDDGQPLTRKELRMIRAVMFGTSVVQGASGPVFRSLDGQRRVVCRFDPDGTNRTITEEPIE